MTTTISALNGQVEDADGGAGAVLSKFVDFDKVKPPPRKPGSDTVFEVSPDTNKITIPADMDKVAVAEAIMRMAKAENETTNVVGTFKCHPNDGAVNVQRLLIEAFGDIRTQGIMGFFGRGTPTSVEVPVGVNQYEQVTVEGELSIPFLPDVQFQFVPDFKNAMLQIYASCRKKHVKAIEHLFEKLKGRLRTHSIFKGKPIDSQYNFLDVSSADPANLIFNEDVRTQLHSNIFTPLANREHLRRYKIPFRRGVLLEGKYGVGKTLVAYTSANVAQQHGVTFLYIRPTDYKNIATYIEIAKRYAPTVIFYEDIDGQASGDDSARNEMLNTILCTLDGIESKQDSDIMVILTTNHVDKINPALLRPGRIDAVVHMAEPDADTAGKLLMLYGRGTLAPDFDWAKAGEACAGMVPAFMRECIERSKLYAISRDPHNLIITADDVIHSAAAMKRHLELATPQSPAPGAETRLASALRDVLISDSTLADVVTTTIRENIDSEYLKPSDR